jgi:glycosyltransferase involved in cell wall biosynthesis
MLVGRVEYAALADYYLGSDCYIFYGGREGSSVAMMEALAYGLPILASDHLENATFVKPDQNGYLVEHPNPEALSRAMIKILDAKDRLPEMGRRSRAVAEHYSWAHAAHLYHVFFEQVLSSGNRRSR